MAEQFSIWREQTGSGDIKSLPSVGKIELIPVSPNKINKFIQQNSPINNEVVRNTVMNELYGTEVDGQLRIFPTEVTVREGHGKVSPVYSLCSFSFDENVDLELLNSKGRYKITGYDRRVYNAVGTLWLNDRKTVSLTEVFSLMNGYARSNPSKKQLEAVEKSLNKLRSIRVYIDLTQEVKAHMVKDKQPLIDAGVLKDRSDSVKSAVIEDNMLHFRVGTIPSPLFRRKARQPR